MTSHDVILLVATAVGSSGLGAVAVALLNWRQMGPKTRQETAKLAAETRETDVDTQDKLIAQVGSLVKDVEAQWTEISKLKRTISEQGDQIAILQRRNRDMAATMRAAVTELLTWIRRALSVMTPDQQASVGQPPDYNHLTAVQDRI